MLRLAMLCTTALLATACTRSQPPADNANDAAEAANNAAAAGLAPQGEGWSAEIKDAAGKDVGLVSYVNGDPMGVPLTIRVHGLPPGTHGMHLHENGTCEPPKFESAGGHWNPGKREHGHDNPKGWHAGDLPEIAVDAQGNGIAHYLIPKDSGDHPNGLSLVIHTGRDDQKTDPSGNSGARIACGVVVPG